MHRHSPIPLTILSLLALSGPAPAGAGPFGNTRNVPFAARCNGPQGAIVIADDGVGTAAVRRAAAIEAQHSSQNLAHAAATLRRLQRAGLQSPRAQVRFPRLAVHTKGGVPVLPDLQRAVGTAELGNPGNNLQFVYQGWSAADEAALKTYMTAAYAKAKYIYGPPAFNITVKVIRDDTIDELQGGIYDATANEIRMPELTGNFPEDSFIFLLLTLRAFHDDIAIAFDAWEEGFVGAAATAIQVQPGVSPSYDPKDPGPFYALSVYEAENHPNLGNSTFYPQSGFAGMMVWRIAMARAAWLKCWIEDNLFFANFNQLYYAQFTADLPLDVLSLREVAAHVLPTVEGLPFQEWYERQYVLDTAVHSGLKEYTWNIPLESAVALIVEHYVTNEEGDESPRGGQARTTYWSYNFAASLYAEEGNLIDVPTTGDTPGEGFLIPTFFNIGGPQRITVQLDLSGIRSYYPYPYGKRGFYAGENNLYGGISNQVEGTIDVTGGQGLSGLAVSRGVWGGIITAGDLAPAKLAVKFTNPDGQEISRQVNVGWDSYVIFLDGGRQTTVTRRFNRGTNGLHLMSFPLTPLSRSSSEVFGVDAEDLLLAHWNPATPPDGRYEVYPDCPPIALGRAFWLRALSDLNLSIAGIPASVTDRVYVPLELGWNMFGSPRLDTVATSDVKVQVGTAVPVALSEAVSQRYVQVGIFGYSQARGYELTEQLAPFGGYWIRCLLAGGCRLVFDPPGSSSAVASEQSAATPQPSWTLPVVATATGMSSSTAYLGAAADATSGVDPAYDMQGPPPFGPHVSVSFLQGGEAGYVADVRSARSGGEVWELRVDCSEAGTPVQLQWPDLSAVPAELRPVLVDTVAGRRVYMRTAPGYTLGAGPEAVSRRLRIELAGAEASTLAVTAAGARAGGSTASICYTLSRAASVQVTVLNIGGRQIRSLLEDAQQAAGTSQVVWNLCSDRGTRVPNGVYMVKIQARADDGQAVAVIRPLRVERP